MNTSGDSIGMSSWYNCLPFDYSVERYFPWEHKDWVQTIDLLTEGSKWKKAMTMTMHFFNLIGLSALAISIQV
jgi:hypothetical protein